VQYDVGSGSGLDHGTAERKSSVRISDFGIAPGPGCVAIEFFSHVVLLYIVEDLHFLYWKRAQEVVAHEVGVQLWYNVGFLHL
jgi:hypothetical protein